MRLSGCVCESGGSEPGCVAQSADPGTWQGAWLAAPGLPQHARSQSLLTPRTCSLLVRCADRPIRAEQALDLAAMGTRHWRIAACSAVTGEGLLGAFEWVVGDVESRIYLLD